MTRAGVLASMALLAACSSPSNPPKVWLAPNGSEQLVRLTPVEPEPF